MKESRLTALDGTTRGLIAQLHDWSTYNERLRGKLDTAMLLNQIGDSGCPTAVPALLCYGMAADRDVAYASRSAIRRLVSLLPLEFLPTFDVTLRRSWRQALQWYGVKPPRAGDLKALTEDDRVFVTLCSCHHDGFIRERVLRALAEDASRLAIAFLIVRLTDWVSQVRSIAEREVLKRLDPANAPALVDCLGLLDCLAKGSRFNPAYKTWIDDLLKRPECEDALIDGLHSTNHLVRRHCTLLSFYNSAISRASTAKQALNDPDVSIRRWLFENGPMLVGDHSIDWLGRAAIDSCAPKRRIAFDAWLKSPLPGKAEGERFLLDPCADIRQPCQAEYQQRFSESPVEIYRRSTSNSSAKERAIAIAGLSEMADRDSSAMLVRFLDDPSAKVRAAAVRSMRTMGMENYEPKFLQLVASDTRSVAREAMTALLNGGKVNISSLWSESLRNADRRVPLALLVLMKKLPKWARLRYYLEAFEVDEASVRRFVGVRMQLWIEGYNRSFEQPSQQDLNAIRLLLERRRNHLPGEFANQLDVLLRHVG